MSKGAFRRRVCGPPFTPPWFGPILTLYLQFVRSHRGLAQKTARKYIQKLSAFAQFLEGAGVTQLSYTTPRHVREFYENVGHSGPRRSYGSILRVFFAGRPSKAGWRTPWAMQFHGRDSIGM